MRFFYFSFNLLTPNDLLFNPDSLIRIFYLIKDIYKKTLCQVKNSILKLICGDSRYL